MDAIATKLTAQGVEFIAKPGKTDELRNFLCLAVTPLLRDRPGFVRATVLTAHGAPRRVEVITFWSTERRIRYPWEETPLVREDLWALIDAASRTSAYQVDFLEAATPPSRALSVQVARRDRMSTTVRQLIS